jgi:hypothetical protein
MKVIVSEENLENITNWDDFPHKVHVVDESELQTFLDFKSSQSGYKNRYHYVKHGGIFLYNVTPRRELE